ncbi:MAG: hypothetical protein LLG00_09795 [Planctomycetaceae bacterium]|nr:hypothetical protein [Planctomycetaceae bacterium]
MPDSSPFVDLLDAADRLSLDEQEALVDILRRRMIDHRRAELVKEVQEAEREYEAGGATPATPDDLMGEVLS